MNSRLYILLIARPAFVLLAVMCLVPLPLLAADTAFQRSIAGYLRKDVDVITVTDVTKAGQAYPPATSEHPVRYMIIHLGMSSFGPSWAGEKIPAKNAVLLWMMRAMRDQGYLLADMQHPPEVVLVFGWGILGDENSGVKLGGSRSLGKYLESEGVPGGFDGALITWQGMSGSEESDLVEGSSVGSRRRALKFLGGDKLDLMWEQDQNAWVFDPRRMIRNIRHTGVAGKVWDFAAGDLFVATVSAYAPATGQEKAPMLWQTRFACPATGLSLEKALPQMILAAAPNLGRETARPINVNASAAFGGKVNMGDFTILNDDVELAGAKTNRQKAKDSLK